MTKSRLEYLLVATAIGSILTFAPSIRVVQAQDGWTNLFDGKSLAGWRGYKQPDASKTRWIVDNGMLAVDTSAGRDRQRDLITTGTFDNFELSFDWKIDPGGNSGLKYFVLEDQNSAIGHEYQIIDDSQHADAKIGGHRQTAAFYDVLPATSRPVKPAGEFNQSRIVVSGNHVEHWLNGTRVLQYELGSAAVQAAIEKSKFKGIERFGKPQKGHILLQDHGDRVWYRSIRIKSTAPRT
jgi:hypothetical protein